MCVFALRITFQMLQNAHPKPAAPAGEGDLELGVALGRGHFFAKKWTEKKTSSCQQQRRACTARTEPILMKATRV